jgi:hypothetical protein
MGSVASDSRGERWRVRISLKPSGKKCAQCRLEFVGFLDVRDMAGSGDLDQLAIRDVFHGLTAQ